MLFYNRTRDLEQETDAVFEAHTGMNSFCTRIYTQVQLANSSLEHCFDYLRETLMCHGDADIMSMTWLPDRKMYTAQFDVIKQCRNFEMLKTWTKKHQTGWWPGHP